MPDSAEVRLSTVCPEDIQNTQLTGTIANGTNCPDNHHLRIHLAIAFSTHLLAF